VWSGRWLPIFRRNASALTSSPTTSKDRSTVEVFRRDTPPTRSRRSIGSGGESSSMLTIVEGNAVQSFPKGNNFLPHCCTERAV
jgi:hypothetical protein